MSSDSILFPIITNDTKMPTFSDTVVCIFFVKPYVTIHVFIPAAWSSPFRDALALMFL